MTSGKKPWSDMTPVAGQQFDYTFDTIGKRTQTKAGGDAVGANLRPASYWPNSLNQYTSREVPGAVDIMGVGLATNAVTVNGQTVYRKGEYFRQQLAVTNTSVALWTNVTVSETGQTSVSGNVFVPKTPENFSYDADGNLTQDGRWTYAWDGENRLTNMTSLTTAPTGSKFKLDFLYDWRGRRIQKLVSTNNGSAYYPLYTNRFVYDGWNLVSILNPQSTAVRSFLWGLDLSGTAQGAGGVGGLLEVNDAATGIHFAPIDGNGNVAALAKATDGTVSGQYEYGPFGEVIRSTGPMAKANPLRFSTKYTDDETDLVRYEPGRYYAPSSGWWLNRDPIAERGGPHLYGFVRNDPIPRIDPHGFVELHYINYPQWEPIDLHGSFPIVEYLWVGHYLTFDAADSSALGGSGVLLLKYNAHATVTACSGSPTVSPVSRQWYFANPFRLNSDGTLVQDPSTYFEMFNDGQAHQFFQVANVSMQAILAKSGGVPSGQGFTRGHFTAEAEVHIISSTAYNPSQDSSTPGEDLPGFSMGDINGHDLGGGWAAFMVDQVPNAWSAGTHWSKKMTVNFDWNDCACPGGQNTWNYSPDPVLTSPGAQRQRYVGPGNDPNYTSINLLNRPHN